MEDFYTPQEVADKLKVDVRTVYRWIRENRLKAAKVVTLWRIPESELKRLIEEGQGDQLKSTGPYVGVFLSDSSDALQ